MSINGHRHLNVRADPAPLHLSVVCPGKAQRGMQDKGSLFLLPITLDDKQEFLFNLHSLGSTS